MRRREFGLGLVATALPAAEWKSLCDGKSFAGWRDTSKMEPVGDSWSVEDGCLTAKLEPQLLEDLETQETFTDFEFVFEWKLAPGGNSGIKYAIAARRFYENSKPGWIDGKLVGSRHFAPGTRGQQYLFGCEFQLIDDERHPDAARGASRKTGSLYSLAACQKPTPTPAGEWHQGRVVKRGVRVEHWVNGTLVLEAKLDSPEVEQGLARSPSRLAEFRAGLLKPSPLVLQNHGDSRVWFRGMRVKA
jgi:hypothetical protein